jgi:hypothetical protein
LVNARVIFAMRRSTQAPVGPVKQTLVGAGLHGRVYDQLVTDAPARIGEMLEVVTDAARSDSEARRLVEAFIAIPGNEGLVVGIYDAAMTLP